MTLFSTVPQTTIEFHTATLMMQPQPFTQGSLLKKKRKGKPAKIFGSRMVGETQEEEKKLIPS